MFDIFMILFASIFFLLCYGLLVLCQRLME